VYRPLVYGHAAPSPASVEPFNRIIALPWASVAPRYAEMCWVAPTATEDC
jgi:hypothetical protein